MKDMKNKIIGACLRLIPVCAAFIITAVVNSSGCWFQGQEELPTGADKYRKY